MALTVLNGIDEVRKAVGAHFGYSEWLEITQERVKQFADATDDHQWIHVHVARTEAGPIHAPVAPSYLTMSLSSYFLPQVVDIQGFGMGVNYGCEKVRFPAPLPVGSRIRGGVELVSVADVPGGVQTVMVITIEEEGDTTPRCVLQAVSRYLV